MEDKFLNPNQSIEVSSIVKHLRNNFKILFLFLILSLFIGFGFNQTLQPKYESVIVIKIIKQIPYVENEDVIKDFISKFHSKEYFNDWKSFQNKPTLIYENIINLEVINGQEFLIEDDTFYKIDYDYGITEDKINGIKITLKTNNLDLIGDLHNFADFISKKISSENLLSARNSIQRLENILINKDLSNTTALLEMVFSLDGFIYDLTEGKQILSSQTPTLPTMLPSKSNLILFMSGFLGLVFGTFYSIIRSKRRIK